VSVPPALLLLATVGTGAGGRPNKGQIQSKSQNTTVDLPPLLLFLTGAGAYFIIKASN
jgi:hypothetical protein